MRISFSQATSYEQCPRLWCYRYIDQHEELPSEALEHGKLVHEQIENVLLGNTKPKLAYQRWAQEFVDDLNAEDMQVELAFEKELEGHILNGKIDVFLVDVYLKDILVDWKTKGKKPDTIMQERTYNQLHLYGYATGLEAGATIIEAYPEWEMVNVGKYDPKHGERVARGLVDVADKAEHLRSVVDGADDVVGFPSWKCKWCGFHDVCKDKK